ncbi:MAG: leucyl aminopeptidase [Eubacteriales bacterium]|jgi:leucyl aminopeptidase|nr:leucyl aminopeptidase [Eubacteriales bacterium]
MITLKPLSQYQETGSITITLMGEKTPRANLPSELKDTLKLLDLKPGKLEAVKTAASGKLRVVLYARLPGELNYDALEALTADMVKQLNELKAKQVDVLLLDAAVKELTSSFYKQLLLAGDCFDRYQTSGVDPLDPSREDKPRESFEPDFTIYLIKGLALKAEEGKLHRAALLAEGIRTARRLVNEPANVLTPERLAQEARALSKQNGFDIEVYDELQIQDMGLQAFWSVAKGSDTPPRFLVMRFMNNPDTAEVLALVGKGLTYDSGGYAIKPAESMATMFCDMGGAAAVIGAISTLAAMKARVNVVAIVAACENMISGRAFHNGDIIGSLAGKNIEVVNTDAEGRLTLADAITYAATVIKADRIIDIATLTGAVGIALGREITGVVADDETIFSALARASELSGDKIWRLPHCEHLAKHNKSERADIKNSGGRPAGTATAALFCRAFAFGKPWGHLDIAGTAYQDKASAKAPAGATGVGVELLALATMELFR